VINQQCANKSSVNCKTFEKEKLIFYPKYKAESNENEPMIFCGET
jgi:hypothetical protein